jgi:hypothetical protein
MGKALDPGPWTLAIGMARLDKAKKVLIRSAVLAQR